MFTLGELTRQVLIIDNSNVEGGAGFGKKAYVTFDGVGSGPSPAQQNITDGTYLQKWESNASSNLEPSITISNSNTKVVIDISILLAQSTSQSDEVPFRIERKINSGSWTEIGILWLAAWTSNIFSNQLFQYVDVHGASNDDVVSYRFKNDGVSLSYSANTVHQWTGPNYPGSIVLTESL